MISSLHNPKIAGARTDPRPKSAAADAQLIFAPRAKN
jgi:hypothetical protein